MSFINIDVHSDFFTPQEHPVEILEVAKNEDVIACCLTPPAKQFVAFMLIKEFYYKNDGISIFIQNPVAVGKDDDITEESVSDGKVNDSKDRKEGEKLDESESESEDNKSTNGEDTIKNTQLPNNNGSNNGNGNPIPICHLPFESLTSIPSTRLPPKTQDNFDVSSTLDRINDKISSSVLLCSGLKFLELCEAAVDNSLLDKTNLIVIDNVHEALRDDDIRKEFLDILSKIRNCNLKRKVENKLPIRIVYLTVSLLHFYGNESDGFWRMEETFKRLETLFCAKVDTTSDVVALLRYSSTPKERVVQFIPAYLEVVAERLSLCVKKILEPVREFLESHTFDALGSYGYDNGVTTISLEDNEESDSMIEELRKIPHPKTEPLQVMEQFLQILDTFGPWCAYRSLVILIHQVEKLKVRTPYERHYLLLGVLHTRFTIIQKALLTEFSKYKPIEVLERFSTPKLRSVLDILRRFDLSKPIEPISRQKERIDDDEDEEEDGDEDFDNGNVRVANEHKQKGGKPKKNVKLEGKPRRGGSRGGRRRQHGNKKTLENVQQSTTEADPEVKEAEDNDSTLKTDEGNENALVNNEETISIDETPNMKKQEEAGATATAAVVDTEGDKESEPVAAPSALTEQKKSHNRRRPAGGHRNRYNRKTKIFQRVDESSLCGIIFMENRFDARILYHFLKEAAFADENLLGLNPTIAIDPNPEYTKDSREAEMEHKRREECLKKFRYREANVLIGTSLLEEGIELPKANLVIRFDPAKSFRSYLFSKGRAQGFDAEYYVFATKDTLSYSLRQLSTYKVVEECLLSRSIVQNPQPSCQNVSSSVLEQNWDSLFPQFKSAKISNAITIINRYCARLPSDTFTRLVPLWRMEIKKREGSDNESQYACCLRLPINSPVKWITRGVPMPTIPLAKQAVALQTVVILHSNGELDDALVPIGKEGVKQEPDLYEGDDNVDDECGEFRPGSTKRRQYYNKQLAPELNQCLPKPETPAYLYWIRMTLSCPLPDEQNTRGRKLHPPECASQCFGIILSTSIPPLPSFPIYTRCGEVHVQLVQVMSEEQPHLLLSEENIEKISAFHHYTFTSVLRLDKYLTLFDPTLSDNSFYVVPLKRIGDTKNDNVEGGPTEAGVTINQEDDNGTVLIDWDFVETIWNERDVTRPKTKSDDERKDYEFKPEEYVDAVVMPWYRNHDVPQYFYVAEICENLTPRSQFPGCEFKTFEEYYSKKYSIAVQNAQQPLLDVDHTSARLNFLTPRYVNRKGMALPTSSESTKKAKRENLEQKQILVPELCAIHPFSASLWRQAVCLPCILYRMNCILLANNIRIMVASQIHGLGIPIVTSEYKWDSLSFGWTLSDVIAASNAMAAIENGEEEDKRNDNCSKKGKSCKNSESAKNENGEMDENSKGEEEEEEEEELTGFAKAAKEATSPNVSLAESLLMDKLFGKSANEILSEEMKKCKPPTLEIGTWSNEMAQETLANEPDYDEDDDELMDPMVALPSNLMMLDKNWTWGGRSRLFNHRVHRALYGSPTHWGEVWDQDAFVPIEDLDDAKSMDADNMSITSDMSGSDESFLDEENNFKIQFHNGNTAEALDKRKLGTAFDRRVREEWCANEDLWWQMDDINGVPDNDEDQDQNDSSTNGFAKEDFLRKNFEERVEEKITKIEDVVAWNEIKLLENRRKKKEDDENLGSAKPSSQYETLFKELTYTRPPPCFPESKDYPEANWGTTKNDKKNFSFDFQPSLSDHVGPSPCQILQALTMSNANDGLNLERLETIGDSFLKYAITSYLFCTFENIHEGKLSHLRSKQVSNVHLYRLGRRRGLGGVMVATKFEPHDNWLPPGYHIPKDLDKAFLSKNAQKAAYIDKSKYWNPEEPIESPTPTKGGSSEVIPYNLVTQQSIPDKSIADCVEALIGAYLTSMGPLGALLFMSWLGIRVLPSRHVSSSELQKIKAEAKGGQLLYMTIPGTEKIIYFETLRPPNSPLLRYDENCEAQLTTLLKGYDQFENWIGYKFRDRSYLLQAFTHASYTPNNLTDCYQRLEFLGDAILDYLITRHLYEDPLQHSPGSLTDLRSALVNNTIFASLAVKNGFHKFFRHSSPGLAVVLQKFVTFQEQHGHTLTQDYYLMDEEECEEAEDIEVPKALGDVFESVAGAIFLDSDMSLDAVWDVYYRIMKQEIEEFSKNVPKSPIRELLELEPETAKFGKPEKLWDGRRVRVSVDIFGVGTFRGIGRNYRIAKCTAAKCALKHVRKIRQSQAAKR